MASCTKICGTKKYTENELRRFEDNVENVLVDSRCKDDYVTFLKETKKIDQVKYVKIWVLVNDLLHNRPQTPDLVPAIEVLRKEIINVPELDDFVDELTDDDKLNDLKKEVCRCLNKSFKFFAKHLKEITNN